MRARSLGARSSHTHAYEYLSQRQTARFIVFCCALLVCRSRFFLSFSLFLSFACLRRRLFVSFCFFPSRVLHFMFLRAFSRSVSSFCVSLFCLLFVVFWFASILFFGYFWPSAYIHHASSQIYLLVFPLFSVRSRSWSLLPSSLSIASYLPFTLLLSLHCICISHFSSHFSSLSTTGFTCALHHAKRQKDVGRPHLFLCFLSTLSLHPHRISIDLRSRLPTNLCALLVRSFRSFRIAGPNKSDFHFSISFAVCFLPLLLLHISKARKLPAPTTKKFYSRHSMRALSSSLFSLSVSSSPLFLFRLSTHRTD